MYAGALCDIHKLTEGILHRPLKTASDRKTLPCGFSLDHFFTSCFIYEALVCIEEHFELSQMGVFQAADVHR